MLRGAKILAFCLFCTFNVCYAQQYVVLKTDNFAIAGNGETVRTIGTAMTFVRVSWNIVGGTLSACTVKAQTSADASSWADLSGSSSTCTSNGTTTFIGTTPNYIRVVLVTKTGSATTLTTTLVGWMALPVAVITAAGAPVGACSNGTLYQNTSTGDLYLCESSAWVLISFGGGGAITGVGDANVLTKWLTASSLGNTTITDSAPTLTAVNRTLVLGGSGFGGELIRLKGSASGSAGIGVAAGAGSPNEVQLPTATGTANYFLQTDGANPQQTSWAQALIPQGLVTAGLGAPIQVGVVRAVAQVAGIGSTTIFTVGAANALFDIKVALNCTTTSAAATVNVTVGWTDTGSQAQTATLGSAVVCTALGAASVGSLSLNFSAKTATTITYSTAIVNTPTYDIRAALYQDTIN